MKENSVAKRYASGLVKAIENDTEYREIRNELNQFLSLLKSSDQFKAGMETFLLSKRQKKEVLDDIRDKAKLRDKSYQFLLTIVDENRLTFLESILQLMEDLWFEKSGIERIKVFSVIPLTPIMEARLQKKLETAFDKKIVLEKGIDPSLIAGIKIQRGLIYYDFSIEGNLKKLKEALMAEHVSGQISAAGEY